MKNTIIFTIWSIIIISLFFKTQAQNQSWSLEQCIEYGKQNNLKIKQEQYNIQLSELNLKGNKASQIPSLNGNASQNFNFGRTVDRFTNEFTTDMVMSNYFYLSSNIKLFDGFQTLNTIKRSKIEYEASVLNLKIIENDISMKIALAYLQILYNIELVQILQQQHEITLKEIERTETRIKLGSTSNTELLNLEAQSATELYQIFKIKVDIEMSYLNLTQILNIPSHKGFRITIPSTSIEKNSTLISIDFILEYALKNHPEIKKSELQIESAKKSYSIAKGAYSPSLSLGANSSTGFSKASMQMTNTDNNTILEIIPFKEQINRNFYYSIGINMTIPIFNSMQTKYNIEKSKITIYQANNLLQQNESNLIKLINQNYYDAQLALEKYYSAQKQLNYLLSFFKVSEEKFALQKISYLEYQDAKTKFQTAESELLQAKFEYIFKKIILDFYIGKPIML
ncbi:MAG: TolC family protein [Bacteroidales bacterium]|nr:TolC family protein [Bacteroidales bacterium]